MNAPDAQDLEACRAYRDALLNAGYLLSMGVDGLYGRSGAFEAIVEGINHAFGTLGDGDRPEVMRFPPGIGRWQLERSGYMKTSPQLVGTVHSFEGDDRDHRDLLGMLERGEDWTARQHGTAITLAPAACYGVYPAVAQRGPLGEAGALVDVYTYCFRHEPSIDPARMQMFRQREHVRIGSPEQVLSFRTLWMERARALVESLGLPFTVEIANDPFFGRAGRMLAANQRDENLKFELLLAIATPARPNACISFNYHRDHFGKAWDIRTHDDRIAHTGCVGFGVERIALALLAHHGLRVADWPQAVRNVLAL